MGVDAKLSERLGFGAWTGRPAVCAVVVAGAVSAGLVSLAAGEASDVNVQGDRAAEPTQLESEQENEFRLREGLTIEDEVGEFRDAGGRITFYPEGRKVTLTVLENLALERVFTELETRRERRQWTVTGRITEYRGGNYLQITRAVMKPKEPTVHEPTGDTDASAADSPEPTPVDR